VTDDFVEGDLFDPEVAVRAEEALYNRARSQDDAVAAHLRRSKEAYSRVFVGGNATPDDVDFVMRDLAWFCKAYDPQWQDDPRAQDRFVARREVYQRIVEYTRLEHDTLVKRYIETQT
tara:strand:+ start:1138 stop:1491 length:354 start_codon:yes stop_codon:yes gene_type:complete